MKGKRLLALILAILMCVALLSSCGGSADDEAPPVPDDGGEVPEKQGEEEDTDQPEEPEGLSDEVITVALQAEPNSMVPDVVFLSNTIQIINRLIYEPLLYADYTTLEIDYDQGLITNVERLDDLRIRLTLREGVKFHNGEEFTTDDIMYQFQEGSKGAQTDYNLFDWEAFEVEDDYNIVLATREPWAQAVDLLSLPYFMVVEKGALEAAGGADTTVQYLEKAGTGKYIFESWEPGQSITLTRNEDYWNKDAMGYFAGYKFVFVADATARAMAVQSGDADLALECQISDYDHYANTEGVKPVVMQIGQAGVLYLNSGKGGPCADVRVREAIYWLIDREAIREVGNAGFGEITDTIISPLGVMYDGKDRPAPEVNVERAKELLAEAGYEDGLTLKFRASSSSASTTLIQEQLRQGGIDAQIVNAEMPVHFAGLGAGDFDIYQSGAQFAYYTEGVRCTDGLNYDYSDVMGGCGYKDEEYSAICERCYRAFDIDERKEAYADLQEYYREHFISVGLYTSVGLTIARPDLENISLFGIGIPDLSNMYSTEV